MNFQKPDNVVKEKENRFYDDFCTNLQNKKINGQKLYYHPKRCLNGTPTTTILTKSFT